MALLPRRARKVRKLGGIDENKRYRAGTGVRGGRNRLFRSAGGIASELLSRIRAGVRARARKARRCRACGGNRALRCRLVRGKIAAIKPAGCGTAAYSCGPGLLGGRYGQSSAIQTP